MDTQEALLELFQKLQDSLGAARRSHDDVALPLFDPQRADSGAAAWCTEIEQLGHEFRWTGQEMVARAGKVLKGAALTWFENWEPEHRDWETFRSEIVDLFPPKRNLSEKLRKAVLLTSDAFDTYCEYAREKLLLLSRTKIKFSDAELVDIVSGDIREVTVKMGALNSGIKTTNELLTLLSGYSKNPRKRPLEPPELNSNRSNSSSSFKLKRCFSCGETSHLQLNCPKIVSRNRIETRHQTSNTNFRGTNDRKPCEFCNKMGHNADSCWAKERADRQTNVKVNLCTNNVSNELTLIMIKGTPVYCLVDTGAACSLMTERTASLVGCHVEPHITNLKGIGAGVVATYGKTLVVIESENVAIELQFFVVRDHDLEYNAIIGKNVVQFDDISIVTDMFGTRLVRNNYVMPNNNVNIVLTDWISTTAINKLEGDNRESLRKLLEKYSEMITTGNAVRCINTAEMKINLKTDSVVNYHPYRLSLIEREKLRCIIDDLLANGIIRESESPFASPVILVKKADGSDRLCVDFRALNRLTIKNRFPLPLIEDQLDRLGKGKYFTTLDMASGFHQIPISEGCIYKTGFVTPDGHYEYCRVAFGLANSPAVFQRAINKALGSLKDSRALVYLDDILIPSLTVSEGLESLELVLAALCKAGFSLNLKKCRFFETSVDYLGRNISAEGIRPGESKVKALIDSPVPSNVRQVRQFMGLAGYFRKFIPEFATRTACVTKLTKQNEPWAWTAEQDKAREYVISHLSNRPLLTIFDPSLTTELHTDASAIGYGAILFQKHESGLCVVAYYSKRTSPEESKYHSYELETLAIVNAIKHFRVYLLGIKFKIITDCNAIKATAHKKDLVPRVARWWMYLQDFNFEIEYRKGKYVAHVDYLSRNPSTKTYKVNLVCEGSWLELEQGRDPETQLLIERIKAGDSVASDFELKNSLLCRKVHKKNHHTSLRYYVPKGCRIGLLRLYHDEQCHIGYDKTLCKIQQQFWFPRISAFVRKYISHCLVCASTKKLSGPKQGLLHSIDKEPIPFQTIHVDCVGPFKATKDGYKHVLLMVDAFTKYILLIPLQTLTGAETYGKLQSYLTLFGTPLRVITDRGTNFTDKRVTKLFTSLNIEHHMVATGASRANGQVERYVATVLSLLAVEIKKVSEWTSALPKVQLTLNSTVQKSTGFTPLHLLMGIDGNNAPVQKLVDSVPPIQTSIDIMKDRTLAYNKMKQNAETQKHRFDKARKDNQQYHVGDYVFIPKTNARAGKLEPQFRGPYKIINLLPGDRFRVENKHFKRGPLVVPKDKIKRWPGEWSDDMVDDIDDTTSLEEFERVFRERNTGQSGRVSAGTSYVGDSPDQLSPDSQEWGTGSEFPQATPTESP